jgi:alanine dehydrogenase
MRKVYVIGAGVTPSMLEKIQTNVGADVQLIVNPTQMQIQEDIRSDSTTIRTEDIYMISQRPQIVEPVCLKKKHCQKGHERPYKYHR